MGDIDTVRTVAELRGRIAVFRAKHERVGLVPTMGALHEGHLTLVRLAKSRNDRVVVTLFVNPKQFGPNEDLARYPRDEASDARMLAAEGADLLFAPEPAEMYPEGHATRVHVEGIGDILEGTFRPGFFTGVATVVSKLLLQALPDEAIFGEKDYQQLQVIKRLTTDLDIPVEIVGGPLIREPDGLAMSSRNAYLSNSERAQAPALHRAIQECARQVALGTPIGTAEEQARSVVHQAGFAKVDYVTVRDAETLAEAPPPARPRRVLAAAWLGATRLIDNVPVPEEPEVPPGDEALGG
jgi:pantoate--beta-alanine ligase